MSTAVLEIDITRKIEIPPGTMKRESSWILVRAGEEPLGVLRLSGRKWTGITPENILDEVRSKMGWNITRKYLQDTYRISTPITILPISVVVCTRNRSEQLKRGLERLSRLDYEKFEIIVVDNAPSDESTSNVAEQYPVRYVREDIAGLDAARNRGIIESSFDIVAFIDDDAEADSYWLKQINKAFQDERVMCVSGFVAPASLDSAAQRVFEIGYGGMGHGFRRRTINREKLSRRKMLWASSFGVGTNMAFRKKVFASVGMFDIALDVGTPSCGAGDVEMFYRVVHDGYNLVYDPSVIVWHTHRVQMSELHKQILYNGRSFGCFLLTCVNNNKASVLTAIRFLLVDWFLKWNLKTLLRPPRNLPRSLPLAELKGMLSSPFAYRASQKRKRKILQVN